ncbi:MAG TPA: HlyC/CorC family transporter [Kiloniellaceae bacterium]|nr:HlyC/CorC family transporter [Kiloniellaceae bacterium]
MEIYLLISLAGILVLLVLSAFFSGSETSLTAASRARMHSMEQAGDPRAEQVNRLLRQKDRLIGAILLGNNLVNIMASSLATGLLIGLFGDAGVLYATIAMTLLVLIFAEVLPKTYAIHHADAVALAVAPVLRIFVIVLAPITLAVRFVVRSILHVFGIELDGSLAEGAAEEELRGVIDLHAGEGEEERHEREMLRSILDLADVWVEEIMVYRRDVIALNVDQPPERILEEVLSSPYTRLPIWKDEPDNIIGVLHAKALLRAIQANPGDLSELDIVEIAADPWFIPDTTDLLSQLQAFRSRHEHFAIVIDEYGEFLGIVTLEDILEEIVGDIADEHDEEIEGVVVMADGSVLADGRVTLRDLNRRFDWRLPDEEASTIAGLVLQEARTIPETGQVFAFHGFSFEIAKRQRNQLTSIKITRLPSETVPPASALKEEDSVETVPDDKEAN